MSIFSGYNCYTARFHRWLGIVKLLGQLPICDSPSAVKSSMIYIPFYTLGSLASKHVLPCWNSSSSPAFACTALFSHNTHLFLLIDIISSLLCIPVHHCSLDHVNQSLSKCRLAAARVKHVLLQIGLEIGVSHTFGKPCNFFLPPKSFLLKIPYQCQPHYYSYLWALRQLRPTVKPFVTLECTLLYRQTSIYIMSYISPPKLSSRAIPTPTLLWSVGLS